MHTHKITLTCVAALMLSAASAQAEQLSSEPQHDNAGRATTGQASQPAGQLNLTAKQKQQLFQAAQDLAPQTFAVGALQPGSKLPNDVKLSRPPKAARETMGSVLRSSQIAKSQDGDLVIANPSTRTVQAVITPEDAQSTTGQGAAHGINTNPNGMK